MKTIVVLLSSFLMNVQLFTGWKNYAFDQEHYAIHFYRDKSDHGEKSRLFHGYGFLTTDKTLMSELREHFEQMKFVHNYQVTTFQRVVVYKDQKPVKMHKCYFSDSKFYLENDGNWYVLSNPNKMIRLINSFDKVFYEWENLVDAPAYEKLK